MFIASSLVSQYVTTHGFARVGPLVSGMDANQMPKSSVNLLCITYTGPQLYCDSDSPLILDTTIAMCFL